MLKVRIEVREEEGTGIQIIELVTSGDGFLRDVGELCGKCVFSLRDYIYYDTEKLKSDFCYEVDGGDLAIRKSKPTLEPAHQNHPTPEHPE